MKRLWLSVPPPNVAAATLLRLGAVIFTELYTTSIHSPWMTLRGVFNRLAVPSSLLTSILLATTTRLLLVPITSLTAMAPAPCEVYTLFRSTLIAPEHPFNRTMKLELLRTSYISLSTTAMLSMYSNMTALEYWLVNRLFLTTNP